VKRSIAAAFLAVALGAGMAACTAKDVHLGPPSDVPAVDAPANVSTGTSVARRVPTVHTPIAW